MSNVEFYQAWKVGRYVSSICDNDNTTDEFYFVLGSIIKENYPDGYLYILKNFNI